MRQTLSGDFPRATRLEWLEANGLGGYASATACGANTRRYHGLLVAAMHPPVGRTVLLSKLDERIGAGGVWTDLGTNQFPGAIYPRGFEQLVTFERDLFPSFEFAAAGVRLRKTVASIQGENTTVILYEVLAAAGEIELELRPFVTQRDYHSLGHADGPRPARFDDGVLALPMLFLSLPGAEFHAAPDWYYRFEYAIERERGLDAEEDLFTPGTLTRRLMPGARYAVVASTDDPRGRDGLALFEAERQRREGLLRGVEGSMARTLTLAADQFIVRRGTDRKTVIAGYHWFTDWGRDTMIALPGLGLTTGRFDDARRILTAFAESASEGMLPNRFPDGGEAPEYNTVDATLWFFVAAHKYLDSTHDEAFVQEHLLPVLRDIVAWHERGTRHNIHVDEDGLLVAGVAGDQLTWMDAKVGDWVVTPRDGKAVEINALWYNALLILADFERRWGSESEALRLSSAAARVRIRFQKLFWNENADALYDVVRFRDDHEEYDASIRPNQIFALSLPHPILESPYAEGVLATVERELLTPFGLRSLSPNDPRFIGTYIGGPRERDGAYHQGTVWSWLLGPYITALVRVRGEAGVTEGLRILAAFEPHLAETCAGSISEIFDGDPPHAPRGCIAQAWSVGELLRAMVEDLGMPSVASAEA
jgi:predicted glycogen debranching enzyme